MEIQDSNVEVLYDFEYATKDGQRVSIREGERLLLIKKTNDDWWQVIRSTGRRPFYVPSSYVKELEKKKDFTVTVSIKPSPANPVVKSKSNTKVFLNCSDPKLAESADSSTSDNGEDEKVGTVLILSGRGGDSGYSTVQLGGRVAEANILEEPLTGSLAELAKQIEFAPSVGSKARSESCMGDLRYSGSFKRKEERRALARRLSESCPEVRNACRNCPDRVDRSSVSGTNKNDSTDSVDSERVSTVGSSSDSVDRPSPKPSRSAENKTSTEIINIKPLPKPRKLHKILKLSSFRVGGSSKSYSTDSKEEVVYANCLELAKERERREAEAIEAGRRDEPEAAAGAPSGRREEPEGAAGGVSSKREDAEAVDGPGKRAGVVPESGGAAARREEAEAAAAARKEEAEAAAVAARRDEVAALGRQAAEVARRLDPEESKREVTPLPEGWSITLDTGTQQTCYIHSPSGDKWFSSSDGEGRVYYYQENGGESSWTLPSHPSPLQLSTASLPDNAQSVEKVGGELETSKSAVELATVLARISGIPDHSRRYRSGKTYSMIEHHTSYKKEDDVSILGAQKNWPQLSEGKMYVLCEGPLHYTKICENGKRVRKNWMSVYVVLTELFLLIYKDMKAFHSLKTPPEVTVDLNGAEVSSAGQKVSGRKHVLVVSTLLGLQVALQCETINSAVHWGTQINSTITNLPKASESTVQNAKLSSINEGTEETKKSSNIGRSKSVNFKTKEGSMEDLGVNSTERQMKIRSMLKKFFHKRPTMESLVKKGIWKDEPVFGCYLEQACGANVPRVPPFVVKCIKCIENSQENMMTDGLYRASGNLSQIQKIRLQIDQNNYSVLDKEEDVHVLTGALKLFFRELKEPLIPYKLFPKAIKACMTSNKKEKLNMFADIIKALPPCNRDTLKFLLQHLLRVTQYQEHNRMHIANVAIVFGPTLMWPEQESINMALDLLQQNMVIENLLSDYNHFFK